ncbi:MAG TPA: universal stress protein [Saprospiraceae bacterium]|nr:universal stress protein [Saprospiraceae bacterium]HMQ85714.1 universal stress protein [Saprospiraceae bacterium]
MKKILFPTDLSEAAERAFIYALHLASKLEAEIITLHVYRKPDLKAATLPNTLSDFYATYDLELFENYKDSIPVLRQLAEQHGFGHLTIHHALEEGKVVPTILKYIERDQIDMVIMGTTGAWGLKEIFTGSVAGELLENSPIPVLAVPEEVQFDGQINQVAFCTSYKEEEKKALEKVIQLFSPFEANIHCLNVDLGHIEFYTQGMKYFQEAFVQHTNLQFQVLEGKDINEAVTAYMREHGIDLLAMVTHKRNFFQELFNYSHAKMMSYHSDIPVLSIPTQIL